jgi:hypothetical protein
MSDQTTARRHGKTGIKSVTHHPELYLHHFETEARASLPALPAAWDGTGGLRALTMLGNGPDPDNPAAYPDGVGDCVRVSEQNGRKFDAVVSVNAEGGDPKWEEGFRPPHTPWTVAGYFEYQLAQGWKGTPPAPEDEPDDGADPASYAKWMFATKQAEVIAEVDVSDPTTAMDNLRRAAIDFNGVAIAVTLTIENMNQFDQNVPFAPGMTSGEGHGLWYCKWDLHDWVATWAEVYPADLDWLPSVLTAAWVYGTKELFSNKGYHAEAIIAAAQALLDPEVAPIAGSTGGALEHARSFIDAKVHELEDLIRRLRG